MELGKHRAGYVKWVKWVAWGDLWALGDLAPGQVLCGGDLAPGAVRCCALPESIAGQMLHVYCYAFSAKSACGDDTMREEKSSTSFCEPSHHAARLHVWYRQIKPNMQSPTYVAT